MPLRFADLCQMIKRQDSPWCLSHCKFQSLSQTLIKTGEVMGIASFLHDKKYDFMAE